MSSTKKNRLLAGVMTPALLLGAGPQAPAQALDPVKMAQAAPDPKKRERERAPRVPPRGPASAAPQHAPRPLAPPQQPAMRVPAPMGAGAPQPHAPAARPPAVFGYPPQAAPRPVAAQPRPLAQPRAPAPVQQRQPMLGEPPARRHGQAPGDGLRAPVGAPTIRRPGASPAPDALDGPRRAPAAGRRDAQPGIGAARPARAPAPVESAAPERPVGGHSPVAPAIGAANRPAAPAPVEPDTLRRAPGGRPAAPGLAEPTAAPAPALRGADHLPAARPGALPANGALAPGDTDGRAHGHQPGGPPAPQAANPPAAPAGAARHAPDDGVIDRPATGAGSRVPGAPVSGAPDVPAGGAHPPGASGGTGRRAPDDGAVGRLGVGARRLPEAPDDSGLGRPGLGAGSRPGAPVADSPHVPPGGQPGDPPAAGGGANRPGGAPFLPGQRGPGGSHAGPPAAGGVIPPGAPAAGASAPGDRFRHGHGGAPGAPPPMVPPQQRGGGSGLSPAAAAAIGAAAGLVGGFMLSQPGVARVDQIHAHRRQFDQDGYTVIEEPGRTIVRDPYGVHIRHDENERFRELGVDLRSERRGDELVTVYPRRDGGEVVTYTDANGVLLRRIRRFPDGREIILIDNSFRGPPRGFADEVVVLPPPPVEIPRERYVVDYGAADEQVVYEALTAPPVAPVPRRYTLDEVRASPSLRAYTRSVDIDTITFDSGSWSVAPDQAQRLSVIAAALNQAIRSNPSEVYLIEGHTDAVGQDVDNLSLSDRRAQSVASLLTRDFGVPAENLTTQGYGEQYPKVQVAGPARENRRVTVRRITPLLSDQQSAGGQ
jgi:outer membrane protein OmpA-like peptidoglycan-associated protein